MKKKTEFELLPEDLMAFALFSDRLEKKGALKIISFMILLITGGIAAIVLKEQFLSLIYVGYVFSVIFCVLVISVLASHIVYKKKIQSIMSRQPEAMGFTLEEESLFFWNRKAEVRIHYSSCIALYNLPAYIMIEINKGSWFILPKRVCSLEEVKEYLLFLEEKTGLKAMGAPLIK